MVYKLLIRSCMVYAESLKILTNENIRLLSSGIQYQALRIIFKALFMASITELHIKTGIENIHNRLLDLSKKYDERATKVIFCLFFCFWFTGFFQTILLQ